MTGLIKRLTRSLSAVALGLLLTASSSAHAGFSKENKAAAPQTAPAIVEDKGEELQRSILAKLEFEEMNLQLVSISAVQGKPACIIKHPGSPEPMVYSIGDVIGGYRIAEIQDQNVKFSRAGRDFFLNQGESSGRDAMADASPSYNVETKSADDGLKKQPAVAGLDGLKLETPQSIAARREAALRAEQTKLAQAKVKVRNRRFETAKLIEDGFSVKQMKRGEAPDRPMRSVASAGGTRAVTSTGFIVPLRGSISSRFGYRTHPIGGDWRFHRGVDIAGSYGAPVASAADGVVVKVQQTFSLGRHVVIRHSNGFETVYGHLSSASVRPGQRVQQGQTIAREGSTGASTGPHLHFEVHYNGEAVDPSRYLRSLR